MDSIWIVAIVIVVLIAAIVAFAMQRRRSQGLQERFGPEYDRAVSETGDRRRAESELSARERRRKKLDIKPLEPAQRDRYLQAWKDTQARFVDSPSEAISEADTLVQKAMRDRGYPVEDFEQRSSDISVDHPEVADDYRAAHGISMANEHGKATTEDLRQAMVHYRSLFDTLLETAKPRAEAREA
jgi:cytoskeletal protein RodZ